jgi:uncharacterized protein (TIGR03435 family)
MPEVSDTELLREYVNSGSENAFAEIVRRHIDFVYSVTLRYVGNSHDAQDLTQVVFIILAKKASALHPQTILTGWLYETARFSAQKFLRTRFRRQFREQQTVMSPTDNDADSENVWQKMSPVLEEGMAKLSAADRTLLALRFFEGKTAAETSAILGIEQWATYKRTTRAVEKLREFFAQRGIAVSASALTGALSTTAIQTAPHGFAASVATGVVKQTALAAPASTLVKEVLNFMAWAKVKTAIAVGATLLVAGGIATITLHQINRRDAWQDMVDGGEMALKALNTTPPQVKIVPSRSHGDQRYQRLWDDIGPSNRWRYIGANASMLDLLRAAFDGDKPNLQLNSEVMLPTNMPDGTYDYIANLHDASSDALASEIKRKFGLVAKHEQRELDVLSLQLDHDSSASLHPAKSPSADATHKQSHFTPDGVMHLRNMPVSRLAEYLERNLNIPIVDHTGLTEKYDFDLPEVLGNTPEERSENARELLRGNFGLQLIPTREPHEVFVVEKIR